MDQFRFGPTSRNSYDNLPSLIGDRKRFMESDKDRISELPDGILHSIIHRLPSQDEVAQTIAISRRWETLWRSYPFVEFDLYKITKCRREFRTEATIGRFKRQTIRRRRDFQKFTEATINRFTRDSLLRMEILKLSLIGEIDEDSFALYSPLVEQLVDLASRRKAEEVSINVTRCSKGSYRAPYFLLPCTLLCDSAVKNLRFKGIELKWGNDHLPLSLKFLRSIYMFDVVIEDERILANLIASSPLLETMDLFGIPKLSKLHVSNAPKLRTLIINGCEDLKEIEIAAPRLHSLSIHLWAEFRCNIELTTPQLHHLVLGYEHSGTLRVSDVAAVLSKLPSLKSFTLIGCIYNQQDWATLRLSVPKLEELMLINPYGLSNIIIDGGPDLTKFSVEYLESCPAELQKCEINHASACRWELHVGRECYKGSIGPQPWFIQFKNFMMNCPQFRTVYIDRHYYLITFDEEEVDNSVLPTAIEHLIITAFVTPDMDGHNDFYIFLDGLLWACRPKFICFYCSFSSEILLEEFSSRYLLTKNSEKGVKEHCHRLKDVRIATKEEKEEEVINASKDMITLLNDPKRVWLLLTWY
ncbi:Putative F-box/LRR-repeat protein At3g18150 [Linum perenne]